MAAQQQQVTMQQANIMARNAILANAKDMWLPIYNIVPAGVIPGQVINIPLRNVGLIKRLLIEVTGTVGFAAGAGSTMTATEFGMANLFSNVQLSDLSNQQRINTTGWHLHYAASARRQAAFGAAYYTSDMRLGSNAAPPVLQLATTGLATVPQGMGPNCLVQAFPGTFASAAGAATSPFRWYVEVPISYGDYDLRGAIYANVVNATMNLQLTFNPTFFAIAAAPDPTMVAYIVNPAAGGAPALAITGFTVYQNFLDQLPQTQNGPVLPMLDLSHAYMLQNTVLSGLITAVDNTIPLANFRQFLSVFCNVDLGAAGLLPGPAGGFVNPGTDINYFALQTANYTNIFRMSPFASKLIFEREIVNNEFPMGLYYWDSRRQPIITTQQGNTQYIVNPNTALALPAVANLQIGFEMLALIAQVTQSGSLPAA